MLCLAPRRRRSGPSWRHASAYLEGKGRVKRVMRVKPPTARERGCVLSARSPRGRAERRPKVSAGLLPHISSARRKLGSAAQKETIQPQIWMRNRGWLVWTNSCKL